jgi:Icc protein
MHHHPAPFGTPLVDNYLLENREEFWAAIKNSPVKLIICGHVHGDYSLTINKVRIESAPATCFQFKKGTSILEVDNHIGYKIHRFCYNIAHSKAETWMEPENVGQIL